MTTIVIAVPENSGALTQLIKAMILALAPIQTFQDFNTFIIETDASKLYLQFDTLEQALQVAQRVKDGVPFANVKLTCVF